MFDYLLHYGCFLCENMENLGTLCEHSVVVVM